MVLWMPNVLFKLHIQNTIPLALFAFCIQMLNIQNNNLNDGQALQYKYGKVISFATTHAMK